MLFPQSLMPDGQPHMEAQDAEEGPRPGIFKAKLRDPLRRPEAQQQPSSRAGRQCSGWCCCAGLGAPVLLAGVSVGSWLLVLYLWPVASQPAAGTLQNEEIPLSCSEASGEEALLPMLPRAVSFRINTEDFLLEVQVRAQPDWLLVCHEGWSSALGLRICQSLGHLRLTHHKRVNLSDIKLNSSRGFAQLPPRLEGLLEEVWLPRNSCTSGQIVSLRCSVLGYPSCPAGGSMWGWSGTVPSGPTRGLWWRGSSLTLSTAPRITTMTSPSCGSGRRSTSQITWVLCACQPRSKIFRGARGAGCLAGATPTPDTPTSQIRSRTRWCPCSAPSSATALACIVGHSPPACCVLATWTGGLMRARVIAGAPWCAWTWAPGTWWGWSAGAVAVQSPITRASMPRLLSSWTGSMTLQGSTRWRSGSLRCRRHGPPTTQDSHHPRASLQGGPLPSQGPDFEPLFLTREPQ
ncbi:transmembrane protease serine 5 isoform X6 [Leptonychotes weddellii]|uniref:Transmembrane protease serine 5 isoform X6 n=1 Tax=Leptonychotes weddellii TaxID=9713 RepID=A0A7F8RVK7_LEPWE|nr:transmembrane protease serine 5 isoform X6 [Leptonychotes weddellii]